MLLNVIDYTHHLQPGIGGDDLVLFILAYNKAYNDADDDMFLKMHSVDKHSKWLKWLL